MNIVGMIPLVDLLPCPDVPVQELRQLPLYPGAWLWPMGVVQCDCAYHPSVWDMRAAFLRPL